MKHARTSLAAAAAAAVLALGLGRADARTLRAADVQPPDYPTVKALNFMADEFGKLTNGKYALKVFANGSLGSEKDTIEQVKFGALDVLRINTGVLDTVCPGMTIPVLPFVFKDTAHMHAVLDGPVGDELLKSCEDQGMVGLAFYDSGARSFYTKKPIQSMADLKGLKIRVQQSDLWVAVMRALGANATPMPYGEVFTGLKTGLIDGAENNLPSYASTHHFEAAKYFTLTEHSMAPEAVMISKRVFGQMTPEEQAALRKSAKDSVPYMRKLWSDMEDQSRDLIAKGGAVVSPIDKTPFQEAMKPVYDQFVPDAKLKALLVKVQDAQNP